MFHISNKLKANLAMLAFTAVWGTSFPLTKNILSQTSIFTFLSLRFTVAAIVLLLIFNRKLSGITRDTFVAGTILGAIFLFSLLFQVSSLKYTSSSNSAFLSGLSVVIVPILTLFFLKTRIKLFLLASMALAITGLFFITGGVKFYLGYGEILAILSAACSALQILFIDKFAKKFEPSLLAILQVVFCSLAYTGIAYAQGYGEINIGSELIFAIFMTGVLGTAVAYTGQVYAQKHTSPTTIALIITAEPVFALLFAMIIPDQFGATEIVTFNKFIGCTAILSAMILAETNPVVFLKKIITKQNSA